MDTLEEKLYAVAAEQNSKSNVSTTCHESKGFLHDFKLSHKTNQRITSLKRLLESWLLIQTSREYHVMIRRIDYVVATWRLIDATGQVLQFGDKKELDMIESFVYDVVRDFNNYTFLYFYWINLIRLNTEETLKKARDIEPRFLNALTDILIENLSDCAKRNYSYGNDNQILLRKNLPLALFMGNFNHFYESLKTVIKNEADFVRLQAYFSLSQWYEGNRASGLSEIASACEGWLINFNHKSHDKLAVDVLMCLSVILEEVLHENLTPAHEFIEIMCEKLHTNSRTEIVPYLYYTYLDREQREEDVERKNSLLRKYTFIESLRDLKFESALKSESIDFQTKQSLFRDLIKRSFDRQIFILNTEAKPKLMQEVSKAESAFPVSNKVKCELLDIELLNFMQDKEHSRALETLTQSAKKDLIPSEVVVMLLAKNFYEQNDLQNLQNLRSAIPVLTTIVDNIFAIETKLVMKNIHLLWKNGQREIALEDALIQYEIIWQNQSNLQNEMFRSTLSSVMRYVSVFMKELCYDGKISSIEIVEKYANICFKKYDDVGLFLTQWETLFFSLKYSHQILADDYLKRNPKIVKNIDFNKALNKAAEYKEVEFFRQLLNIALHFDLDLQAKSKILSSLLSFYCNSNNKRSAKECMKMSTQLKIPVSFESKQLYETLNVDAGILSKLLEHFKPIKKS